MFEYCLDQCKNNKNQDYEVIAIMVDPQQKRTQRIQSIDTLMPIHKSRVNKLNYTQSTFHIHQSAQKIENQSKDLSIQSSQKDDNANFKTLLESEERYQENFTPIRILERMSYQCKIIHAGSHRKKFIELSFNKKKQKKLQLTINKNLMKN